MAEQLSWLESSKTEPPDRLLFLVYLDADAAACTTRLAQRLCADHRLRGKPRPTNLFHVTLHHLGDYYGVPGSIVTAAKEAGSFVSESSFQAVFNIAGSFNRRSGGCPLVLQGDEGVTALKTFQQMLSLAMKRVGLGEKVNDRFTPHITLLYDRHLVTKQSVEPVTWIVREFVLVHSLLGQTKHIPLARWSLRERS